jgi:hypothetical protein
LATPNYGYEKRQKELAKKRKKEDKLKAKTERKTDAPDDLNPDASDLQDQPSAPTDINQSPSSAA